MGGIYIIICTADNSFYIGRSVNYEKRMKDHFRDLRRGNHKNPRMQHTFDKYGEKFFKHELMMILPPDEKIQSYFEKKLIDMYIKKENCLNVNELSCGGCIVPMTEERKMKISISHTGEKAYFFGKKRPEHGRKLSIMMKGHKLSDETKRKISAAHKGKTIPESAKKKLSEYWSGSGNPKYGMKGKLNPMSKPVIQIDESTGAVIREWENAKQVGRELGYDPSCIGKVCRGKLKHIYGYIWKYKESVTTIESKKRP